MQKKIIISIITFVIFLIFAASTLYVSIAILQPSIKLGSGFEETSCLVTGTNTESTCNNIKCTSQNTDIWWYNSYGPSYFFVYVSGGSGNSDYSDDGGDDDDDGGDDEDDGGEDDDGEDDSGTSDGGDSGGGDSGGGDSGGGDFGSGGGDDMKRVKQSLTTGSAEFVGYKTQEIKDRKLENKLKKLNAAAAAARVKDSSNSSEPVATTGTTGSAPMSSGSSNYASSASGCNTCYQGTFYVSYNVDNGSSISSDIQGLVSSDYTWVSGYVANYANNSYYTCYYQQDTIENVLWFKPPPYSKSALVGTIILSIISLIFLIISLALFFSGMKNSHHHHNKHHNKHHSGAGKYKSINNSGVTTPTAAPISAKKGYQSYHVTNGSYHGGYEAPAPIYNAAAPAQYYQYNQGVAQIDFSSNNNNINYVQKPQYGNY